MRPLVLSPAIALIVALSLPVLASAQISLKPLQPGKLPNFSLPAKPGEAPAVDPQKIVDPQKMFEQFFGRGGLGEADEKALAKVQISWDEEARLGKQGLDSYKQQLAARHVEIATRGKDVEYVARLVELIHPLMKQAGRYRKLQVYVVEADEPGAWSLPGGHLLFSRGMLESAECEAALVVTAGHELGHLDRGHLLRRAKQWKLAQASLANPAKGFAPDKMLQSMTMMVQLFQRPFGPDEELEADRDGITWAFRLGYDPRAVQLVFDTLEKNGKAPPNFMPAFLRTHPLSAERRENLIKTFTDLAAADPSAKLYIGRENLAQRLTRKQKEFPE